VLQLVSMFLLILAVMVFYDYCVLMWVACLLFGNVLLIHSDVVNLRLHKPWFDVCWRFGVVGLEWYPCCRMKHN